MEARTSGNKRWNCLEPALLFQVPGIGVLGPWPRDFQAKYLKLMYSSTWVQAKYLKLMYSEGPRTEYPYTRYLEE